MDAPTLKPGHYLLQDVSITRSFVTTDTSLATYASAKHAPIVILPSGVLASSWVIEKNNHPEADGIKYGKYTVKANGLPVSPTQDGKIGALAAGRQTNDWNIESHRIGTGEFVWSIGKTPGPEVYYWSVSHNPHDHDEHGHRRVVLRAEGGPTLRELFVLTPLEPEVEVSTNIDSAPAAAAKAGAGSATGKGGASAPAIPASGSF